MSSMAEGLAGQCRFHKKNERMFDIFCISFFKNEICLIDTRTRRKSDTRKSVEKAVFYFSCGSRHHQEHSLPRARVNFLIQAIILGP